MGEACSMQRRDEKCKKFWIGNLKESDHFEDLGIDGWIILKLIINKIGGV
jgi:hypothetical protein